MQEIRSVELKENIGKQVEVKGWLHNLRQLGGISFIVLRDGWGIVQAVTENNEDLNPLKDVHLESVITLQGVVIASPAAPGGAELHQPKVAVVTPVSEPPPLALNKAQLNAGLPTLLNHGVIAHRHPQRQALFRLAAGVMAGFRSALNARHFVEVQTPKIVASATEGGSNVFKLDYFGRPAYLAQSPQFYKQIMVGVFQRVYEVGPVFRAEPHDTSRHVNEYVSLDVEFGFIDNHFTVMALLRDVLAGIFKTLTSQYKAEIAILDASLPQVGAQIPHIEFSAAQELILNKHGVDVRGEPDLSPQDERWLGQWAQEKHHSDFLFVTGYPMSKRPFYTHPNPKNRAFSNSFDLLFRGTELVTGGQRLHRYEDYIDALNAAQLPLEPFQTYLEAFRYGMPPHGGFAIGLERMIMQLLDLPNLRLATLFPRDLNRLAP